MNISNNFDALRALLGINLAEPATAQGKNGASAGFHGLGNDRATLSSAASEVSQSAAEDGVRAEKVAAIQSALVAGTYSVPASEVAARLVDSMLASGR